jgi:hypothetical protein
MGKGLRHYLAKAPMFTKFGLEMLSSYRPHLHSTVYWFIGVTRLSLRFVVVLPRIISALASWTDQ